ncbi:hypothetical protein BaRGS_00036325 [Batillaria attramentaria]|uniref:Uncharacterized protein n=1 Tax=Batillaria attramentaria TaxID=370345 RepID=A0ABD0JC46_9CAEN
MRGGKVRYGSHPRTQYALMHTIGAIWSRGIGDSSRRYGPWCHCCWLPRRVPRMVTSPIRSLRLGEGSKSRYAVPTALLSVFFDFLHF